MKLKVLVVTLGESRVRMLATGKKTHLEFASSPGLTPSKMVSGVRKLAGDWEYDAVSLGYPGPVTHNQPFAGSRHLGKGWPSFDYQAGLERPVKIINGDAMQALGCYKRGRMLFLGLGAGLGSAMIVDGVIAPMDLGRLPFKGGTCEDYAGTRGLEKHGGRKWRTFVDEMVEKFVSVLEPDDVVLGGGNVGKLKTLPKGCRMGDSANSFLGGFLLWSDADARAIASSRKNRL